MKQRIRYTVIAKTIPEYSKRDNCLYDCTVGVGYFADGSIELIRVYPTPISGMNKWTIYEIEVEKNPRDSRSESWKLSSMTRKNNWVGIDNDLIEIGVANKAKINQWLSGLISPSVSELNMMRKSIGVIEAESKNIFKAPNNSYYNKEQLPLFEDIGEDVDLAGWAKYTKNFNSYAFRITFSDMDGKHDLQFNEWGLYEGTRKGYDLDMDKLYGDKNLVLIGNMNSHRTTWIGLSVFTKNSQTLLFS